MDPLGGLSGSTILGVVGVAVGVLGAAATIASIAYARRRANLVFHQEGDLLVAGRPADELEVRWRHRVVPAVSRTQIWMWNAGSVTLERSATVAGYPLRFSWGNKSIEILDIDILARSKEENLVRIERDTKESNAVTIDFEYLDARDGVVFDVLHTSPAFQATPSGTLKGTPKTLQEPLRDQPLPSRIGYVSPIAAAMLFAALAVLYGIIALGGNKGDPWVVWGVVALFAVLSARRFSSAWDVWRKAPPWRLRQKANAERAARSKARSAAAS